MLSVRRVKRFQMYLISSAIVIFIVLMGILLYFVSNNILMLLLSFFLAVMVLLIFLTIQPKYYRQTSQTAEIRDTVLNSRKAEIAGLICDECKRTGALLWKVSAAVDTESEKSELDRLGQELALMKCCSSLFEVQPDELWAVDLTSLTTRAAEVRDRLGAIKRSAAKKYEPILQKRNAEREKGLNELFLVGYDIMQQYSKFKGLCSRHSQTLEELVEQEEETELLTKETIDACIGEISRILLSESGKKGVAVAGSELEKIKVSDENFTEKAKQLSILRKKIQTIFEADFTDFKKSLLRSIESVIRAAKVDSLSVFREKLNAKAEAVRQLNDPGGIGKLRAIEQEYTEFVKSYFEELSKKARDMRKDLLDYKPSKEMLIKLPTRIEAPKGNLEEFTNKLIASLLEIAPNFEQLSINVRVLRSYSKVERLIDSRLTESGKVSAGDLDIRHPELFFVLYKKNHPKVKLIKSPEPKLIAGN